MAHGEPGQGKPRIICRALEEEDAVRLSELARTKGGPKALAVLFALYQAFRRADIATVRWDDIREDGWINVHGKGDLPARLALHPVVVEALTKYERSDPVWVFPGDPRRGTPHVVPATICTGCEPSPRKRASASSRRTGFGHTCLATANDGTGDLRATMDFARHSKADTTAGYTRSTERRLRAVVDAIRYETGDPLTTEEPAGNVLEDPELRRLMETWLKLAPAARRFLNVTAEQIVANETLASTRRRGERTAPRP